MRFRYITSLLIVIPILFSAGNAWSCITDASLPSEEDLRYPPDNAISFRAVITKISAHGRIDRGKPHGGFQLKLEITNAYQGVNLGDTIVVNYGGCHNLPGEQGSVISVLALPSKQEGWQAPAHWQRSDNPLQTKRLLVSVVVIILNLLMRVVLKNETQQIQY
jgi:hypothetical protein